MIDRARLVAVSRRVGTAAVLLGALGTVIMGGGFVYGVPNILDEEPVWAPILGVAGILAVLTGAVCAVLVARDLARGSLSRRAELWTWAATLALTLQLFVSVWFAVAGLLCPIITLVAVRTARGPLRSR